MVKGVTIKCEMFCENKKKRLKYSPDYKCQYKQYIWDLINPCIVSHSNLLVRK